MVKLAGSVLLSCDDGYTGPEHVRGLLGNHERRGINVTTPIWCLLDFELWHRHWIAGQPT
jgi:hypothetical protein